LNGLSQNLAYTGLTTVLITCAKYVGNRFSALDSVGVNIDLKCHC